MNPLTNWTARRSGPAITVAHATGKIANIAAIEARDNETVAIAVNGAEYPLATPASADIVSALERMVAKFGMIPVHKLSLGQADALVEARQALAARVTS